MLDYSPWVNCEQVVSIASELIVCVSYRMEGRRDSSVAPFIITSLSMFSMCFALCNHLAVSSRVGGNSIESIIKLSVKVKKEWFQACLLL